VFSFTILEPANLSADMQA